MPATTLLLGAGLLFQSAFASESTLTLPEQTHANIEFALPKNHATDIDGNAAEALQVFVGDRQSCCTGKTPIAGRYHIDGNTITFDPAFDFIRGQVYTIRTQQHSNTADAIFDLQEFTIESTEASTLPEVLAIYPGGELIPENTLRFYVHFSVPMQPHMATRFIKLIDASGQTDSEAFMQFKQELWSEDRKRLTLLMDPGRIKRGVEQNLRLGPALVEGQHYSIVVDAGWAAAAGSLKSQRFEKSFAVSKALRTLPDTDNWQITPPESNSRHALEIRFDRPFDHQLAQTAISIFDNHGNPLNGAVSLHNHEHTWRFIPEQHWSTRTYRISVDARLEDVAGNNFIELLDHAVDTTSDNFSRILIPLEPTPADP